MPSAYLLVQWAEQDSNLRRRKPAGLQPAPIVHSGTRPGFRGAYSIAPGVWPQAARLKPHASGPPKATGGTRTHNLRFTKPPLCQLSYGGGVKEPRSAQRPVQLAFAKSQFCANLGDAGPRRDRTASNRHG